MIILKYKPHIAFLLAVSLLGFSCSSTFSQPLSPPLTGGSENPSNSHSTPYLTGANSQPLPETDPLQSQTVPSTSLIQAKSVHCLSLTDTLNLLERQNPQLLAARKNMDISQSGIKIAGEIPNPQIQAYHYWGNIVNLGTNEQIGITQQIETAGKRHKRVVTAKAQNRLNQAQYNALLWDLRSQTRQAYIQLASAKENILLVDAQAELAHNLVRIANKRVMAGAAPISEQLQAELSYSQIGTQRIQAMTQLRQARGQLNALIGNPLSPGGDEGYDISDEGYFNGTVKTELVPFPNTAMPDYQVLLQKAQEKRPDLIAALRQVEVNQNQLKLTQAQRIPDLSVSVGYPFLKVKQSVAPINGQTYYQGIWAQVGFTVPVFHNQGAEIQQGKATLEQAQLEVNAVRQQLVNELYTAMQGLEGSRENIKLYRQTLLPSSNEVLRLAQKSYQVGKTGVTSVIVAQQQIQQVRQGYVQSVLDYHKAWSDLEKAVGSRLDF